MKKAFSKFAKTTSDLVGSPWSFGAAVLLILVWGVSGPIFKFSDTWQLVINTGTTIITFLIVFLIQNTQNRQGLATQLKLDELVHAMRGAKNSMINIESLSEKDLKKIEEQFKSLREGKMDQAS